MPDVGQLYPLMYERIVKRALDEDLGLAGDVTSDTVIPEDAFIRARLVARRPGRVAGLPVALSVFRLLCPQLAIVVDFADGTDVPSNGTIADIEGPARPILTAERTALNLLCGLCGIATATRTAVEVVAGTRTRIVCTRKTTPGLRALEKYAVRVGGGVNHRFGLDDGVMIKDNHIVAAGGIDAAIRRARERLGHMVKIEIEVDTLDQLREVIAVGADAVLLDNMSLAELREAVALVDGQDGDRGVGRHHPRQPGRGGGRRRRHRLARLAHSQRADPRHRSRRRAAVGACLEGRPADGGRLVSARSPQPSPRAGEGASGSERVRRHRLWHASVGFGVDNVSSVWPEGSRHLHFIDGTDGGFTFAACAMKAQVAAACVDASTVHQGGPASM